MCITQGVLKSDITMLCKSADYHITENNQKIRVLILSSKNPSEGNGVFPFVLFKFYLKVYEFVLSSFFSTSFFF